MILEQAILSVLPGQESEFEIAFSEARQIIEGMSGFISLRLARGIESTSNYLLLVEWNTLEDHTEGFRQSTEYLRWKELLHHFYDPFPVVEHFKDIL